MSIRIELLRSQVFSLICPYDEAVVAHLRRLERRKWNAEHKRWEIHFAHLAEVMRLVGLKAGEIDPRLVRHYRLWQAEARGPLRIDLGPLHGKIRGEGAPLEAIDLATSYEVQGAEYSKAARGGKWDGRRHLFSFQTRSFPAGLWPRVKQELERAQCAYQLREECPAAATGEAPEQQDNAEPEQAAASETAGAAAAPATPDPALPLGAAGLGLDEAHVARMAERLRPYQLEAIGRAVDGRRGIVQVATGGGKTVLAAHLIARIGRPALFFVHTLDLLYQAARVLERELGCEVGLLGDGQAKLRQVTVATVQTAARLYDAGETRAALKEEAAAPAIAAAATPARRKGKAAPAPAEKPGASTPAAAPEEEETTARSERPLDLDEAGRREVNAAIARAGLVIFDECHHVPALTFYRIAMKTRGAHWRFGLSATPWRDDNQDMLLEAALGATLHQTTCSALIEAGYLVAPRILLTPAPAPARLPRRLPYHDVYQAAIVENRERNRAIAARAREWAAAGRSVLVLVAQVTHGERLREWLPEAPLVHGGLGSEERQACLKALEQKLQPIMIATTLADEGLDVPTLDAVILAGGGKSATRAFQRIGRALRPAPAKQEALILDFRDEAPYLREHSRARQRLYAQEPCFLIEDA